MSTWYERAVSIIDQVHAGLPPDAGLKARRKALLAAKPNDFAVTSWGSKTWARAQREYLARYGYVPKTGGNAAQLPLSPLERARAKALTKSEAAT